MSSLKRRKNRILGLVFLLIITPGLLAAYTVKFAWDANTEPDLTGYRLYQSDASRDYVFGDGNVVAEADANVTALELPDVGDGTHYWVLTAYDSEGNESGPSNEVSITLDAGAVIMHIGGRRRRVDRRRSTDRCR